MPARLEGLWPDLKREASWIKILGSYPGFVEVIGIYIGFPSLSWIIKQTAGQPISWPPTIIMEKIIESHLYMPRLWGVDRQSQPDRGRARTVGQGRIDDRGKGRYNKKRQWDLFIYSLCDFLCEQGCITATRFLSNGYRVMVLIAATFQTRLREGEACYCEAWLKLWSNTPLFTELALPE